MCVAAFSSCSTRLYIACLVLSKLQSLPIQLRLAQAKLVTCLASKRSQRHWVVDGLLSLLVIVLEYCGLICCRPKYIIIEAPKTDLACNVRPKGVRMITYVRHSQHLWESCFAANRYILPSCALFPKDILPPLIISKSDIVSIINNSFTMAFSLTSCPRCMQTCSPLGQPGTSPFSFNVPSWSTEYVCG
jgi:hypothetical protein